MDITEFETNLNELIQSGCTEISACYVGDGKRVIVHDGCTVSGTAQEYLNIVSENPAGFVVADYRDLSSISFRVTETPNEWDFKVRQITKDGITAVINVG